MMAGLLGLGHPLADRLEDFRTPQFRDQQAERISFGGTRAHVASRPGSTPNQTRQLEFAERAVHSDSGSLKRFHKFVFAWKFLTGDILSGSDRLFQMVDDLLVFRSSTIHGSHGLIIQLWRSVFKRDLVRGSCTTRPEIRSAARFGGKLRNRSPRCYRDR